MEKINLERSGFKWAKLCKELGHLDENCCHYLNDGSADDPSVWNSVCTQIARQFPSSTTGNISHIQVTDLLEQPCIVQMIDKFIHTHGLAPGALSNAVTKNVLKSVAYRTRGNEEYGRKHFSEASYLYTLAIVYAPNVEKTVDEIPDKVNSSELSLAYGNRSAVFYELGWLQSCLNDIEQALVTGSSRDKLPKLLFRKVETLLQLNRLVEAKQTLGKIELKNGECEERMARIRLQLLNIGELGSKDCQQNGKHYDGDRALPGITLLTQTKRFEPCSTDVFASVKTKIESTASKGRFKTAKCDIEPGDILTVEAPFAVILDKPYEMHFCHHCCRKLEIDLTADQEQPEGLLCTNGSVLPCTQCTRVLYCSSSCRTESWRSYHRYECGQLLSVLHQLDNVCRLSLRILFATGLNVIFQVANLESGVQELLLNETDSEVITRYERFYDLAHNTSAKSSNELLESIITSALLVQLAKKCGFIRSSEEATICGRVLQRHQFVVQANSRELARLLSNEHGDFVHTAIGCSIYMACSMLNHSCEPNVAISYVCGSMAIQRAIKRIAIGEEVTESYVNFNEQDLAKRQEHLWDNYAFRCDCSRCVRELRDGIDSNYFPIACKKCSCTLIREAPYSATYGCPSCSAQMSLSDMKRLYSEIESHLAAAYSLVHLNQQSGGGPVSGAQLQTFEHHLIELISVPGMKLHWKMADLYYWAATQYTAAQSLSKAVRFFEIGYQFCQHVATLSPQNYDHLVTLSAMYLTEGDVKKGTECLSRAIKMIRQLALVDIQGASLLRCAGAGGGLLDEDSLHLWEQHRCLVDKLRMILGIESKKAG